MENEPLISKRDLKEAIYHILQEKYDNGKLDIVDAYNNSANTISIKKANWPLVCNIAKANNNGTIKLVHSKWINEHIRFKGKDDEPPTTKGTNTTVDGKTYDGIGDLEGYEGDHDIYLTNMFLGKPEIIVKVYYGRTEYEKWPEEKKKYVERSFMNLDAEFHFVPKDDSDTELRNLLIFFKDNILYNYASSLIDKYQKQETARVTTDIMQLDTLCKG